MSRQQYIEGLMLVDGNNRAHAAYHAYKRLFFKGRSVSVIFGLPSMLKSLIFNDSPGKIIMVWDGKKSEERLKVHPSYKAHRKKDPMFDYEDFTRQRMVVRKMLYYLGVPQILNPEAEADDMIAKVTRIAQDKYKTVTIVSGDKDFNQLINDKVRVFSEAKKNLIVLGNCKDIFGYAPSETVDYLTLVGDDSDGIPGYPGIGPVKARQLLDKYGTLEDFLDSGDKFLHIKRSLLLEIKRRNEFLIDLKLFYSLHKDKLKTVYYRDEKDPGIKVTKFKELCAKYGLQKFLASGFLDEFMELKDRQD